MKTFLKKETIKNEMSNSQNKLTVSKEYISKTIVDNNFKTFNIIDKIDDEKYIYFIKNKNYFKDDIAEIPNKKIILKLSNLNEDEISVNEFLVRLQLKITFYYIQKCKEFIDLWYIEKEESLKKIINYNEVNPSYPILYMIKCNYCKYLFWLKIVTSLCSSQIVDYEIAFLKLFKINRLIFNLENFEGTVDDMQNEGNELFLRFWGNVNPNIIDYYSYYTNVFLPIYSIKESNDFYLIKELFYVGTEFMCRNYNISIKLNDEKIMIEDLINEYFYSAFETLSK